MFLAILCVPVVLIWRISKRNTYPKSLAKSVIRNSDYDLEQKEKYTSPMLIVNEHIGGRPHLSILPFQLRNNYSLVEKVYDKISRDTNSQFVSINELQQIFDDQYPEYRLDLTRFVFEVANSYEGFIRVQRTRQDVYMLEIVKDSNTRSKDGAYSGS